MMSIEAVGSPLSKLAKENASLGWWSCYFRLVLQLVHGGIGQLGDDRACVFGRKSERG